MYKSYDDKEDDNIKPLSISELNRLQQEEQQRQLHLKNVPSNISKQNDTDWAKALGYTPKEVEEMREAVQAGILARAIAHTNTTNEANGGEAQDNYWLTGIEENDPDWGDPEVLLSYIVERHGGTISQPIPYYTLIVSNIPPNRLHPDLLPNYGEGTVINRYRRDYKITININGKQSTISTSDNTLRMVNGQWVVNHRHLMEHHDLSEEESTHQTGDFFNTLENATLAWALAYHPRSGRTEIFPRGSEWGTWIYREREYYEYEKECGDVIEKYRDRYKFGGRPRFVAPNHLANRRSETSVSMGMPTLEGFENAERVSFIHTHPTNQGWLSAYNPERFSKEDAYHAQLVAREHGGESLMLVTPLGYIRALSPENPYGDRWRSTVNNNSNYITNVLSGNSNIFECEATSEVLKWASPTL